MYLKKLIAEDTYYVGASDRRLALFENIYPLKNGVSYNSYLILDEKTCLLDSCDRSVEEIYLDKVETVLEGRKLDYLVVEHMEPDHCASIMGIIKRYPSVTLVMNAKSKVMFENFNNDYKHESIILVNENDKLELGKHTLLFINAPMVHWPEVMMSYDLYTKTLFSADAFGTFEALSGKLFADEVDFEHLFLDEARRYYTNIVGKYGTQVQAVLKKAASIEIATIAPLHGPIWRKNLKWFISYYDKWSRYEEEVKGVLIVYGSIYGNSEKVANLIAENLDELGVKKIAIFDASKTDKSELVAQTFKYSHLVVVSSTYNMGIFTPVEEYLLDLKYHNVQNKKVALVENGSWAPNSLSLMKKIFEEMKNIKIVDASFTVKSAIKSNQLEDVKKLAREISKDLIIENKASNPLFNIPYGLYLLFTKDKDKDNGCIVNSVMQVAENKDKIAVSINKKNYTCDLISSSKKANISILTTETPFSLIKNFGFQSGKDVDKFKEFENKDRSENGIYYLNKYSNSYISLDVKEEVDLGSHKLFIGEITSKKILNDDISLTYSYYQNNIKEKITPNKEVKVGWICKVCGYIYEGEELPKDFICPLCKHGVEAFEKIKN